VRYVDVGTTSVAQDGSIENPFDSFGDAIADLPNGGTVYVVPGDYSAETIVIGPDQPFAFVAYPSQPVFPAITRTLAPASITSESDLYIEAMQVADISLVRDPVTMLTLVDVENGSGSISCANLTGMGRVTSNSLNHVDASETTVASYYNFGEDSFIQGTFFNCGFAASSGHDSFASGIFYQCNATTAHCTLFGTFHDCQITGGAEIFTGSTADLATFQQAGGTTPAALTLFTGNTTKSNLGWNAAAPVTLTLLLANHHPKGLYLVTAEFIKRTSATTGTATRTIDWSAPTIGALTKTTTGFDLAASGATLQGETPLVIESDGTADISVTFTPATVTGSPVIDVYATATPQSSG
jgi:hypothetical protein